ncbi:N-acyl-L-amino acid amidohydrolase [marine bacterium AO1-C]|nr:N-acyl-L-amino acid amidohydrolase [marine bacterium AO1-C]
MYLKDEIKRLAKEYSGEVRRFRRFLHANPELSFNEDQTAEYVADQLLAFGLHPTEGIAETGVVATIEGKKPKSKVIALRADMDALPIQEENNVPYKSRNPGIMHACGHDVHTAILLGTAKVLQQIRASFEGTVKLIFQPGEEVTPSGAPMMIKEGVLDATRGKRVKSIYAHHVYPETKVGKVGFKVGPMLASCDDIFITVKGKGGHAAFPDDVVDTVLIASQLVVSLQQIVSRNAPPHVPSVLSFGRIVANGTNNIIPDTAVIEGTFRTFDEVWRADAIQRITTLAKAVAQGMGGDCDISITPGCPSLHNASELTKRSIKQAQSFLGEENVEIIPNLIMGSEDFAFYSHEVDACFWALGVRNEAKNIVSNIHTPTFDIDEDAMEVGVGLMAWLALTELGVKEQKIKDSSVDEIWKR